MQDAQTIETLRQKFQALVADLDERGRRRWAAVEARALGRGGIAAVATATGLSDRTVRNGLAERDDPQPLAPDRQRRAGGGAQAVSAGATPTARRPGSVDRADDPRRTHQPAA